MSATAGPHDDRIAARDWDAIGRELDAFGCAPIGRVLDDDECREIVDLYTDDERFRSTVDMARHRFGEGRYRYFTYPLPEPVARVRAACWPHLLPIAREWYGRLDRAAPWPDTLDEWLDACHRAGQDRPTPLLLRYEAGDWNALHRDLYGDTTRDRPVPSRRGWSAAPLRHGLSALRGGRRHALGVIFHDAA